MKSYLTSQDYAVMKCCKPKSNSRNWCLIRISSSFWSSVLNPWSLHLDHLFLHHSHYISTLGLTTFVVPFLNFSKWATSCIVLCSFTLVVPMGPILWRTLSIDKMKTGLWVRGAPFYCDSITLDKEACPAAPLWSIKALMVNKSPNGIYSR